MQKKSSIEDDSSQFYEELNLGQNLRFTGPEVYHTYIKMCARKVIYLLFFGTIFGHCIQKRLNFYIIQEKMRFTFYKGIKNGVFSLFIGITGHSPCMFV